jgi:hypothetical protein
LKLYRQYIRPVLEYGAIVTVAASKPQIERLQKVQNYALRVALNLPMFTRIEDLHLAANIVPVEQRLTELGQNCIKRLKNNSDLFPPILELTQIAYPGRSGFSANRQGPLEILLPPEEVGAAT